MQKLKNLLILGGIFQIISFLLSISDNDICLLIWGLFFLVFIISAIVFLFRKNVLWTQKIITKHNVLMPFLYAIGWIPYISLPYFIAGMVMGYNGAMAAYNGVEYAPTNPELLGLFLTAYYIALGAGLILSLLLATVYVLRNFYMSHKSSTKKAHSQ